MVRAAWLCPVSRRTVARFAFTAIKSDRHRSALCARVPSFARPQSASVPVAAAAMHYRHRHSSCVHTSIRQRRWISKRLETPEGACPQRKPYEALSPVKPHPGHSAGIACTYRSSLSMAAYGRCCIALNLPGPLPSNISPRPRVGSGPRRPRDANALPHDICRLRRRAFGFRRTLPRRRANNKGEHDDARNRT
jgi:hypothetical protein